MDLCPFIKQASIHVYISRFSLIGDYPYPCSIIVIAAFVAVIMISSLLKVNLKSLLYRLP